MTHDWWRSAVIYQVYPRSFADADGDGIGDLSGIRSRLGHLTDLGIDALWLSPFLASPQKDHGYDVSDYRAVDPLFGDLAAFDALLADCHARGIRLIMDMIPNHSSDRHPAFQAALAAGPGSPERAKYVFRDGRGPAGDLPPTDWVHGLGGSPWERVTEADGTPGQWYLHIFDVSQPDWDWTNPWVREEFRGILRFWLDRGVDGFRIDVAHGMVKAEGLPSFPERVTEQIIPTADPATRPPFWDQDGVHEIFRDWHRVLGEYGPDRILVAEAYLVPERLVRYVRPDEMQQAFNFRFALTPWRAADIREIVDSSLAADRSVGAPTTWVLSNHDLVRHSSRLGYPAGTPIPAGIGIGDPQPDRALGLRRARAYSLLMLGLPGSAYLYQGEELGLPEVTDLPDEAREDYVWKITGGAVRGRDGCRVPLPWTASGAAHGFSATGASWLPQPADWGSFSVETESGDPDSTLTLYRRALAVRRELRLGDGDVSWIEGMPEGALAARNGSLAVVANTTDGPLVVPVTGEPVVVSSPGVAVVAGGIRVPADTTAWLRLA